MNWKDLCARLGIALDSAETDAGARLLVLRLLGLKDDADDVAVQRAVALRDRKPRARKPGAVLAKGKWWQIRAAANDSAEILIYGDIGESWWGESVTARSLVEQLQTITAETITVRINSFGGAVADGIAIHNALRKHPAEIITDVEGAAFSVASLIAMAGDTVRMSQGTLMMIHAPWGAPVGNAVEIRRYADVLDRFAEAMVSAYTRKAGDDRTEEVRAMLTDGDDHYFDPGEALAFGLVDEVTESQAVAAHFDLSRYPGLPAAAAAFTRKESSMNWKAIAKALGLPENTPIATLQARLKELGLEGENITVEQVQAKLAPPTPPGETAEQVQARITARNTEIRNVLRPFRARAGFAEFEAEVLADVSITVDQVRDRALAKLGAGVEPLNPQVQAGETSEEKRREAMVLATLQRAGIRKDPDTQKDIVFDGANPYRGLTLREVARVALQASGRNTHGMSGLDVARAVLVRAAGGQSTSDMPVFLENVLHKMVMTGFQAITPAYARFCKIGVVTDYRPHRRIVPGMLATLDLVNEAGEYKNKNLPDGEKESIQAKRRGNIIEITPETLVNDDLGAITDTARGLGMAGPRTIDRAVFALLAQNANLGPTLTKDSKTLIHADHGNSGTGAVSVATLSALAQKMAKQKFPGDDAEIMDLRPRIAVANTIVGGDIRVHNDSQYDPANNNQKPNKVRGMLTDVVETERMPATIFYLFADPNIAPVIEVVFLDGVQTVRVVQEENFRTGGLAWRGELNADVGAVDYRGVVYSTGA